jgi:hypothetical protein
VGDVRGAAALGGGGDEDLRDGILTLPVAIAIRDPKAAVLFRNPNRDGLAVLMKEMAASLTEAERYLDRVSDEAIDEAEAVADDPEPLLVLAHHTRRLSKS